MADWKRPMRRSRFSVLLKVSTAKSWRSKFCIVQHFEAVPQRGCRLEACSQPPCGCEAFGGFIHAVREEVLFAAAVIVVASVRVAFVILSLN